MRNSIDLFDEMMNKAEGIKPEPLKIDISPEAEGMTPELFDDLLNSIQEIADIESGKIDTSDYRIENLDTELYWGKAQGDELEW